MAEKPLPERPGSEEKLARTSRRMCCLPGLLVLNPFRLALLTLYCLS